MRTVSLQEICDIQIGKTPSRSVPEYWGGELPWVTISDFAAGRIVTTTKERITRIGAVKSGSKRIPRGTLLLSFKLSLGKRAVSGCDLFTNEAIAALHVRDHDVADRDYLYWALGSIDYDRLVDRAAKGKTLNKAKLKILQMPLPPLAEQKRIAGILDAADALRAKRRAALAYLDTLTQSIFLDMFGDPATNPNEMCKLPLGDLIKLKSGEFLPATEMVASGPYPVLGGNGINGFHDQYMFEDPKIVIGRVGVYCGCVHASPPRSCVTDNALYVSEWSPRLRFEYLLHALTHARLNQYASQSGQPLVSGSRIYPVAIVVPPAELQIAFEERIASTGKLKRLYDAAISKVDVLLAALQHRAFQGGL